MRLLRRLPPILTLHKVCIVMLMLSVLGVRSLAQTVKRDLSKQSDVEAYVDKLTGFGILKGISKSFERVDVNNDNTPFLHKQINGKKNVWRIKIKNVRLKLKSVKPGVKDRYVRNFEVLVDPNTGHLLRITSKFDVNDPNMLPEPPAAVADKQMKNSNEIYEGFPAEPPKISLLDALDAVGSEGMGSPFLAKEIYAVYVLHSWFAGPPMGWQSRPVWAITLRGLDPPIPLIGPGDDIPEKDLPPVWQLNHMRNIVDAVSGHVLFATSRPQPVPPEEKKKE